VDLIALQKSKLAAIRRNRLYDKYVKYLVYDDYIRIFVSFKELPETKSVITTATLVSFDQSLRKIEEVFAMFEENFENALNDHKEHEF